MVGLLLNGRTRAFACGLAMAVVTTAGAGQAAASPAGDNVVVSFTKLDLTLNGDLPERCQASGGGDIDFGSNLSGGLAATATFGLQCNIPFSLTVTSALGGLAHADLPGGQGPFAGTLGYTMDVKVPTLTAAGPGQTVGGTFNSAARSKTFDSATDAIATGGGSITFLTNASTGAGLLAGAYSDTVTITVSAQ